MSLASAREIPLLLPPCVQHHLLFLQHLLMATVKSKYVGNIHYFFQMPRTAVAPGQAGDAGVFNDSILKQALINGSLNLPKAVSSMSNSQTKVSYQMVGDDAFPINKHLQKP